MRARMSVASLGREDAASSNFRRAAHLDDVLFSEEFIVAAVGVGMDIPAIAVQEVEDLREKD